MSNIPVKKESRWLELWAEFKRLIGFVDDDGIAAEQRPAQSTGQSPDPRVKRESPGSKVNGDLSGGPAGDIEFGKFYAIALPPETEAASLHPSNEDRDSIAQSFALSVQKALQAFGFKQYEFVEFYLPASVENLFRSIYDSETRITKFRRICEETLFDNSNFTARSQRTQRVYVVQEKISFSPYFERILQGTVLVRPLVSGNVLVPLPGSPAEVNWQVDQLLIGLLQIYNIDGDIVDEAPIWAWRAIRDQNSILINVDFDLMTRAFPPERHYFPLGLNIRCNLRLMPNNVRVISGVSMEMRETKRWLELLDLVGNGDKVIYEIKPGGGQRALNLRDYPKDFYDLAVESDAERFPLGKDEQGIREAKINRYIGFRVRGDKTYTYYFGFFETALCYVPARNIMRVTGQLVLRGEPTTVLLPPGPGLRQEAVFTLTPDESARNRFKLKLLPTNLIVRLRNSAQPLTPNAETVIGFGEEIIATRETKMDGRTETCKFTLRDLRDVPAEIIQRDGERRPYAAVVEVEPPQNRKFVLSEKESTFGRGNGFSDNAYGIGFSALKFTRPYVYLKMSAGKDQHIYYVNKADTDPLGIHSANVLGQEEVLLQLNGNYEIYLGDFQITLNLRASAATSLATEQPSGGGQEPEG